MIELFSRRIKGVTLPPDAILTPFPVEDDISSLSAILLDSGYYDFLKSGVMILDGIPILDAQHLIPFKAKAWLDLSARKAKGEQIDSKVIRKHKNDVFKLYSVLPVNLAIALPEIVKADMLAFISANIAENTAELLRIAEYYRIKDDLLLI
ncbi:MAG: hypothetical protein FWF85_07485 [Clostridiales bacterium]|nr:hypothetical protein [Clostridiales bacterium]